MVSQRNQCTHAQFIFIYPTQKSGKLVFFFFFKFYFIFKLYITVLDLPNNTNMIIKIKVKPRWENNKQTMHS